MLVVIECCFSGPLKMYVCVCACMPGVRTAKVSHQSSVHYPRMNYQNNRTTISSILMALVFGFFRMKFGSQWSVEYSYFDPCLTLEVVCGFKIWSQWSVEYSLYFDPCLTLEVVCGFKIWSQCSAEYSLYFDPCLTLEVVCGF